jgi:hypothetical protein
MSMKKPITRHILKNDNRNAIGERPESRSDRFTITTHCIGRCWDPRAGLDVMVKRKVCASAGNWTPVVQPLIHSLQWLSCPAIFSSPQGYVLSIHCIVLVVLYKLSNVNRDPYSTLWLTHFLLLWYMIVPGSTLSGTLCYYGWRYAYGDSSRVGE